MLVDLVVEGEGRRGQEQVGFHVGVGGGCSEQLQAGSSGRPEARRGCEARVRSRSANVETGAIETVPTRTSSGARVLGESGSEQGRVAAERVAHRHPPVPDPGVEVPSSPDAVDHAAGLRLTDVVGVRPGGSGALVVGLHHDETSRDPLVEGEIHRRRVVVPGIVRAVIGGEHAGVGSAAGRAVRPADHRPAAFGRGAAGQRHHRRFGHVGAVPYRRRVVQDERVHGGIGEHVRAGEGTGPDEGTRRRRRQRRRRNVERAPVRPDGHGGGPGTPGTGPEH